MLYENLEASFVLFNEWVRKGVLTGNLKMSGVMRFHKRGKN